MLTILTICVPVLVVFIMLHEGTNEYLEHSWLKEGYFHNFMHTSKGTAHVPTGEDLIVFVHIPRTSGETLKISLFNDVAYQFNPEWVDELHCHSCSDLWDCGRFLWLCQKFRGRGDKLGPPAPKLWEHDNHDKIGQMKAVERGNMIQGFFSRMDIERLRNSTSRRLKIFTVLRHPIERSLSWMQMTNVSCPRVPWAPSCAEATYLSYYKEPPQVRTDLDQERQELLAAYIVSYGHNSMTWQLGHQMHSKFRDIPEQDALQRAKGFLEQMDEVFFFEDMLFDFPRLWRGIFSQSSGSTAQIVLYMLGCTFGYPRMHTLKYYAHLTAEEREAVLGANRLDSELYSWARVRFGAKTHLYESNTALMSSFIPVVAASLVVCAIARYVCIYIRWHRDGTKSA